MSAADPRESVRYVVEGGRRLAGSIEPGGNKNAALPIIAASLLTDQTVILENVPRIRDTETLVDLVRSVGADAKWTKTNELEITAKTVRAVDLDPELCAKIRASILLGVGCGLPLSAAEYAAIARFADAMGLAFQVVDDILDVEGSSPQLGKTPGKDALQNKPTYVSVLGMAAAKARASSLRDEAIEALACFGPRAARLADMADFILLRRH